jgi:regulatory protein
LLARREHSQTELFRKLLKKNFLDDDIHPVLNTLAQEGLLSDDRFIENFIHYQRNRGFGPLRIHNDLLERGISEKLIEHHLEIKDNAWLISIRSVWQKRFKNGLPNEYKARAQQMRFLQYRGFTHDQIKSIMNNDEE